LADSDARHALAAQQGRRPGTRPLPANRISSDSHLIRSPDPTFSSQWIVVDAKVYDLSRFVNLHPGGRAVLVDTAVAGQDATGAFYSLHRHEVLERPQYARLQIGVLRGEKSVITGRLVGGLSAVPYAEPTYLSKGFHSPYYTEVRARLPGAFWFAGGHSRFFWMVWGAHRLERNLLWGWGLFVVIESQGVPEGRQEVLR
jgi:hypothetical protein